MSNDFTYLYVLDIAAHNAGKNDLDEKALSRLVEVGGQTPEFHLILGKAYLNREEMDKAISELEQAAATNSTLPYVHFSLGLAYMRKQDNDRAEAEFRKDIAIEPDLRAEAETIELGRRLVSAGFVETHIHLDKSCIIERCDCGQGTLQEAIAAVATAGLLLELALTMPYVPPPIATARKTPRSASWSAW